MENYKICSYGIGKVFITSVQRISDGASIPLVIQNRDCVQFLTNWKAGAEVTNPDNTPAAYSDAAVTALGLTPPA